MKMQLISIVLSIACLAGLLYQVTLIMNEYFKYSTSSSVTLIQSDVYHLPSMSVCFKFNEIFDHDNFNRKYNLSVSRAANKSGLGIEQLATIGDIFQFTPQVDSMIFACEYRDSITLKYHSYMPWDAIGITPCYKHFILQKYLISTQVCYKITLRPALNQSYSRGTAYFTPSDRGDIFFFFSNIDKKSNFDTVTIVMHPTDNYPWHEFSLSQTLRRGYNPITNKTIVNLFGSQSHSIVLKKLTPPYETRCQDYQKINFRDAQHCLSECIGLKLEKTFRKVSPSRLYFKKNDLKLMTNDDVATKHFNRTYQSISSNCKKICPPNDCTFTSTHTQSKEEDFVGFGVYATLPDRPSFMISYTEIVLFLDTIAFFFSVIGLWSGLYVYGILSSFVTMKTVKKEGATLTHQTKPRVNVRYQKSVLRDRSFERRMNVIISRLMSQETKIDHMIRLVNLVYET